MRVPVLLAASLAAAAAATLAWLPQETARRPDRAPGAPGTVRVAAVQFHSVMGDVKRNRDGLAALVRQAAAGGAKIVVLPETAISGYADIGTDTYWSSEDVWIEGFVPAERVAERADGVSVTFFAALAKECGIYLTVPFVEAADGLFYNSVVLAGPDGGTKIHYRKQHPWTVADPSWMTRGDLGTPVIDTEYGRLGVMVCYDVNALLPEFAEKRADIVLHCVAWYGPWFDVRFNRRVDEANVALVLANWTFPEDPGWRGAGASRVIGPDGRELARIASDYGDGIVYADLPAVAR